MTTGPSPNVSPDSPTGGVRVLLGLLLAAALLVFVVPVVAGLFVLFSGGVVFGAAVALDHTGGLEPGAFRAAHYGVGFLLALVGLAFLWRRLHRGAPRTWVDRVLAYLARSPWLAVFLVLSSATVTVARFAWDTRWVPAELPAGLVLNDLYLLVGGSLYIAVVALTRLGRSLFRSATASRYRAGVATGLLATLLVAFGPSGARSGAEGADSPVLGRWASVAASSAAQGSIVEAERRILVEADRFIDPDVPPRPLAPTPPEPAPPVPTPPPAPAQVVAAQASTDQAAFSRCLQDLAAADEQKVRVLLMKSYRLSEDDAFDIARDALIDVCVAHARRPYQAPGAVLVVAAANNAKDDWKRRKRFRCGITEEPPSCGPAPDDFTRFGGELKIAERALCGEDEQHRAVFLLRLHYGLEFAAIGGTLRISEDDARSKFNNALRRVQKRVRDACGG